MATKKKSSKASSGKGDDGGLPRIAIINTQKCKPKKCNQECKKSCPVVKLGKLCIEVGPKSKLAFIAAPLCIGEWMFPMFLPEGYEEFNELPSDWNVHQAPSAGVSPDAYQIRLAGGLSSQKGQNAEKITITKQTMELCDRYRE